MSSETELKLAFPAEAADAIRQHPMLTALQRLDRDTLQNSYFDTPEELLGKSRIALRTRRTRTEFLQTIKCAAISTGGLSQRPEWESPISNGFDFSIVTDAATRQLLEANATRIQPLFVTDFQRDTLLFAPRPGVRILVMIDHGEIRAAGRNAALAELELELAEGSPTELFDFAMSLARELPLMPEDLSKAERGYMLFHDTPRKPLRADRSRLGAQMSTSEAFRDIANEILRCWQANALGALLEDSPDFIHQLRVSLRRLRTLLRLFEDLLPPIFAERWQGELAALADAAGRTRDLDVLRTSLMQPAMGAARTPDFTPLENALLARRKLAHLGTFTILATPPSRLLLLEFARTLHTLPGLTTDLPLPCFVCQHLHKLHKAAGKRLRTARDTGRHADLHRLRIALKRLRYAVEFFSSLYEGEALTHWRAQMGSLQDMLGHINDVDTGLAALRTWQKEDAALTAPVEYLAHFHGKHADKLADEAIEQASTLLALRRPWQKMCNKFAAE